MKKWVLLIIALTLLILSACLGWAGTLDGGTHLPALPGQTPMPTSTTPQPTPDPTPVPTPVPLRICVFMAPESDQAQADRYAEAIRAQADSQGIDCVVRKGDAPVNEVYDAIIVYAAPGFDYGLFVSDIPEETAVVVYDSDHTASPTSASASGRFSLLYYESGLALDALYESALTYPPHDTPVRFVGMFESEKSPAAQWLQELYMAGKALPKASFYADAGEASEWMEEMLGRFIEGTVDGIVAENETLALTALDALKRNNRQDMEIFCVGLSEQTRAAMRDNPKLFVAAVGKSEKQMGEACFDAAMRVIGGQGTSVLAYIPAISDDAPPKLASEGFVLATKPEPSPELSPSPS